MKTDQRENDREDDSMETCDIDRTRTDRPLNVLFVAAYDSTNYVLVNIIRGLKISGCTYTLIVKNPNDDINNKMFTENGIEFISQNEFRTADLDSFDIAVLTPVIFNDFKKLYWKIYRRHIFVVSFATLFTSVTMRVNPDLVLCLGESKFQEFRENNLRYNLLAIGNPQYDHLIAEKAQRKKTPARPVKRVLVIDQGGYPYGARGKRQLAETLKNIAAGNPEMTFYIKPRYLPSERGEMLHVVSDHLYDFLQEHPKNLILIRKPTNLEELILRFDAVITNWSTAYIDAAVFGLPLLLIGGLDSVDVFDVRKQRVAQAYAHLEKTGCVVPFRDLWDKKLVFHKVDRSFLEKEVYHPDELCTPRIIELFQFVKKNMIDQNERFYGFFEKTTDEFYRDFRYIERIQKDQHKYIVWKKIFNKSNTFMQNFVFENRCMGWAMDGTRLETTWEPEVSDDSPDEVVEQTLISLQETETRLKNELFENYEKSLTEDRFLQDFYFKWLFDNKRYETLLMFDRRYICSDESYEYYTALALQQLGKHRESREHIYHFLELAIRKHDKMLWKERRYVASIRPFLKGFRIYPFFLYLFRQYRQGKYDVVCSLDSPRINADSLLTFFKLRSFHKSGSHALGFRLYQDHLECRANYRAGRFKSFKKFLLYLITAAFSPLVKLEIHFDYHLEAEKCKQPLSQKSDATTKETLGLQKT